MSWFPVRFKVVDLEGNLNLQYIDGDDVWHPVPIAELTDEERNRLNAEEQHAVSPEAAEAAVGRTGTP